MAFTYDRLGRQQIITDAVGTRTFTYNATMQPESETITGLQETTITRTYETSGVTGRSSGFFLGSDQQASDYRVSYGYDSSTGRFQSVSWNVLGNSETTVYSYLNDSNLIETLATGNSQLVRYAYEPQRNLKIRISNTVNNNLISQYDYGYDAAGRRQNVMNSGQAFTTPGFNLYNYNTRNELTGSNRYQGENVLDTSTPTPAENRSYSYDSIGNRTTATDWNSDQALANELTYTANRLNQYDLITSTIQPEKSLSFDQDGNLTGIRTGTKKVRYSYDAENRLVTVAPAMPDEGGIKVEFLYDYMGRRVQKKVFTLSAEEWTPESDTFFTYDGWNLIRENKTVSNGQPQERFYVWGLDLSQSLQGAGGIGGLLSMVDVAHESSYLYFYDGNGNVGQFVDSFIGGIGGHYEYDPYGNLVNSWGASAEDNPFRFSTKYFDDETGLVYFDNRYYSPELGRWWNRDPIAEQGGLNLYSFVENSPIDFVDVLGLFMPATHKLITSEVLTESGASEELIKKAIEGNLYVDRGENQTNNNEHSMKDFRQYKFDAEHNVIAFRRKQLRLAEEFWRAGMCGEAMFELGQGIHSIQDEYAHDYATLPWHIINPIYFYRDIFPAQHQYTQATEESRKYVKRFYKIVSDALCNCK